MSDKPPSLPKGMNPVMGNTFEHGVSRHRIGDQLTVHVGGDILRADIAQILTPDFYTVILSTVPVSPGSRYRRGDILYVERATAELLGTEIWCVVSDHELEQRKRRAELERDQAREAEEADRKKLAERRERTMRRQKQVKDAADKAQKEAEAQPAIDNWSA